MMVSMSTTLLSVLWFKGRRDTRSFRRYFLAYQGRRYGPDADRKRVYLSLQSVQIGGDMSAFASDTVLCVGSLDEPAAEIAEPPQMDMSFVVRWCSFMVSIRKKKLGS